MTALASWRLSHIISGLRQRWTCLCDILEERFRIAGAFPGNFYLIVTLKVDFTRPHDQKIKKMYAIQN
jgi:hypothetical protein